MSSADFGLVLVLGFVSSLHCLQMCGPIVLAYSVSGSGFETRRPALLPHLAYNAGRTLTYMALGAVAGAAGGAVEFLGRLAGLQNVTAIVAGSAMVIAGLVLFGLGPGKSAFRGFALPTRFLRPLGKLISSPTGTSKFSLGLLLGFLPCGLVYAALMKAIGTARPLAGALTLLAFGLGTSTALIAVGVGASVLTRKVANWGTVISAISVMILGVLLITRGAMGGALTQHCTMHH